MTMTPAMVVVEWTMVAAFVSIAAAMLAASVRFIWLLVKGKVF